MKFKAICSKENQKLTISLEALDTLTARNILHKQGYSIIEISTVIEESLLEGNFFYFDIRIDGLIKSGQIQSNDIFKAYKKLVQDLGNDVVYIYTSKNMPEEQKRIITAKVKSGYDLYIETTKTKEQQEKETRDEVNDINADVYNQISPETKKEIVKYNTIIDQVIVKLQDIIIKYNTSLSEERKLRFTEAQQALYQSKSSSNIGKLKLVAESALLKIGEVELELVKLEVGDEKKKFFEQTNKLLKEVGSKSKFEIKEAWKVPAFVIKLQNLFKRLSKEATAIAEENIQPASVNLKTDKNSFGFYKNLRELKIYKSLLHKTEMLIFKKMIRFEKNEVNRLLLKRKLLYQNIQIIENRVNNKNFSYTKIIRGADYYIHAILFVIGYVGDILLYTILCYSLVFILYMTLNKTGGNIDLRDNLAFIVAILSGFILTTRFCSNIFYFGVSLIIFLGFFLLLSLNF